MIKAGDQVTVARWGNKNGNPPILELLPKPGEIGEVKRYAGVTRFDGGGKAESTVYSTYVWIVDFHGYGELEVHRDELVPIGEWSRRHRQDLA